MRLAAAHVRCLTIAGAYLMPYASDQIFRSPLVLPIACGGVVVSWLIFRPCTRPAVPRGFEVLPARSNISSWSQMKRS